MRILTLAFAVVILGAPLAGAQDRRLPPTFRCDFAAGDGRTVSSTATEPLQAPMIHDIIFTNIALGAGTALQILPTGETPLTVAASGAETVHLMETAPNGTVTLTTIFLNTSRDVDGGGFTYPVFRAVMSRHVAAFRGKAEASQAYGSCKGVR